MIRLLHKSVFVLLLIMALCCSVPAFAQSDEDLAAQQASEAMDLAQKEKAMTDAQMNKQITDSIDAMSSKFSKAMGFQRVLRQMHNTGDIPDVSTKQAIAIEQIRGIAIADYLRDDLNRINLQTILGYQTVQGQNLESLPNIYKDGRESAKATLFKDYNDLFCIKTSPNVDSKACGAAAQDYGITSPETFVDFILGEKTWPNKAVLETMQLARAFYGYIPDTFNIDTVRNSPKDFITEQSKIAQSNMKMAIINYLASRRGPTSSATTTVLQSLARNFLPQQAVSGLDYSTFCTKDKKTPAEEYICSYTNKPDASTGDSENRIISQAAVDRIAQYDTYLSPTFYSSIQGPLPAGALDKMEVFIKAQQLTQDYRELRMLQLKTAATAMRLMNSK